MSGDVTLPVHGQLGWDAVINQDLTNLDTLKVEATQEQADIAGVLAKVVPLTSVQTVTASTATASAFAFVECNTTSNSVTLSLPPSPATGTRVTVRKTDASANVVTIQATIDGTANPTLTVQYETVDLIWDGTSWMRMVRPRLANLVDYPATSDSRYLQKSGGSVSGTLTVGSSGTLGDNGVGELAVADATTVPSTNPAGGSVIYSASGTAVPLKMRDTSGNVRGLVPAWATATVDQPSVGTGQTSSTYLTANVEANAVYRVSAWVYWTTTNSATVTTSWATTATGATMIWNDSTSGGDVVTSLTGVSPSWATGTKMVFIQGILTTVATAGALTFTFASSVAASMTVKAGSYLFLDRIK